MKTTLLYYTFIFWITISLLSQIFILLVFQMKSLQKCGDIFYENRGRWKVLIFKDDFWKSSGLFIFRFENHIFISGTWFYIIFTFRFKSVLKYNDQNLFHFVKFKAFSYKRQSKNKKPWNIIYNIGRHNHEWPSYKKKNVLRRHQRQEYNWCHHFMLFSSCSWATA